MKTEKTKLLIAIEALETAGFTVDKAEMDRFSDSVGLTGAIIIRLHPDDVKVGGRQD